MNKALKLGLLLLLVSLIPVSPVKAWSVTTHYDIVDAAYYSLPPDVQAKLNLSKMREGADDPDLKFRDFRFHKYPNTRIKAEYWLNKGRDSYLLGDYDDASYCFGVASHYISDSFCAPHCMDDPPNISHGLYETDAMNLLPQVTYLTGNLNSMLYQGHLEGQKIWENWLSTEDESYTQYNLNQAASASYTAIRDSVT